MRNGFFAAFGAAMLVVTLVPRAKAVSGFHVKASWLAQRESALGDWEAVRAPLREGDELQLTVLASDDACVYVLDGDRRQLFPPADAPSQAHVRAEWPYAIPGRHLTWRLDGAAHDHLYLIAARHPLRDPAAELSRASHVGRGADLELPLRDGRPGAALTHVLDGGEVLIDRFDAR